MVKYMNHEKIINQLNILEHQIEHAIDSFKDLKEKLNTLKEDQNTTIEDIKMRQRNHARDEYDDIRKKYNDLVIEIERLEKAYNKTGDPKIKKNLDFKRNSLQALKARKSNSYWEKVIIGREYKIEKMNNSIRESLEYDNLQKIFRAVNFIQSNTDYGRLTINGEQVDANDPAGITQSAEEFKNSQIGTEIEHALFFNSEIQEGYFIVSGIRGEQQHIAYFFEENPKIKIVDPYLIENFLPKYESQGFISKDNENQVVNLYKKYFPGEYQVFKNLDFIVGQPISLLEDLIIQNWNLGLLDRKQPEIQQVPTTDIEEEPVQENFMFWHEADMNRESGEGGESPIPNNGANLSSADLEKRNLEARENVFKNKMEQLEDQIANIKVQIDERNENIQNIKTQMENNPNPATRLAAENRIKQIRRQIQTLQDKIKGLEETSSRIRKDMEELKESTDLLEAKTPVEVALSGSTGAIFNYLLTGTSTGNIQDDYLAERLKESAVIRNILFKYDRELKKVNPDKEIVSTLKLKLKSEINKFKKNR